MERNENAEHVGLLAMRDKALSPYFCDLLERADALRDGKNCIRPYRKQEDPLFEKDPPFEKWIAEAASRCRAGVSPKQVFLVSGELFYQHWNTLSRTPAPGSGQSVLDFFFEQCRVDGICCSYVNRPSLKEAPEAAGINTMYDDVFARAAAEQNLNIRLYSSYIREECHWICVGDEMHVVDWHPPCVGDANERENTFIMRGPAIAEFAQKEFAYTLKRLDFRWNMQVPPDEYWRWRKSGALSDSHDGDVVPYLRKGAEGLFQSRTTAEIQTIFESNTDERLCNPYSSRVYHTAE